MWESSKIVPTVTVNCSRHPPHFQTPLRTCASFLDVLGSSRYALFSSPQCGQIGPSGHLCVSKKARALSSSLKCLARDARLSSSFSMPEIIVLQAWVCQV